jgi:hypothetical protein
MKELRAQLYQRDGEQDLLVEALAPVEGTKDYRAIAFKASRIYSVFAIDADISAIQLDNGITIPVALKFPDLKQKVYNNDFSTGDSLDLTLVTGPRVGEVQSIRLAKTFNPVAADDTGEKKDIEITAFVHAKANDREFKRITFNESMIGHFEAHQDRRDREIFIKLKGGHYIEGLNEFYVALPISHFTYYLQQAAVNGTYKVDLGEATRPKDVSQLRM